jgi:hypothetical protein
MRPGVLMKKNLFALLFVSICCLVTKAGSLNEMTAREYVLLRGEIEKSKDGREAVEIFGRSKASKGVSIVASEGASDELLKKLTLELTYGKNTKHFYNTEKILIRVGSGLSVNCSPIDKAIECAIGGEHELQTMLEKLSSLLYQNRENARKAMKDMNFSPILKDGDRNTMYVAGTFAEADAYCKERNMQLPTAFELAQAASLKGSSVTFIFAKTDLEKINDGDSRITSIAGKKDINYSTTVSLDQQFEDFIYNPNNYDRWTPPGEYNIAEGQHVAVWTRSQDVSTISNKPNWLLFDNGDGKFYSQSRAKWPFRVICKGN